MLQTYRGIIDQDGKLKILEDVQLPRSRQVILTILDDEPTDDLINLAVLSESALAEDWERPEEDESMVTLSPASIIVISFPFSDLSATKLRPALAISILAGTGQNDWLLCQITSNPYVDPQAIRVTNAELSKGKLNAISFVRPMKLFTANQN